MLLWDIYEIQSKQPIKGVMLRGRIRKLMLEKGVDLIADNATDKENTVRFAILTGTSPEEITEYLERVLDDVQVVLVKESVKNPVLSKMKVNRESRYTL